ncbi:MAG: methylated-DNA--[protein]-cysteine S-methyltransferase [Oscillospiraceae bacterium]|jgi:methylated-DNA-[protein]-cysteine S-methyltransferase
MNYASPCPSPLGTLWMLANESSITAILFPGNLPGADHMVQETPLLLEAKKQLSEYFCGKRHAFDLPLEPKGTPYQKTVWDALKTIPYGETRSYGDIARQIQNPKGARSVGSANHNNPIPIIIPCHRVIGANGSLTGYGGGLDIKTFLLHLEQNVTS